MAPKPEVERSVFEAFLRARGLECTSDEIHQPGPPAPDVLWRPAAGTPVEFELTEAVEQPVARDLAMDRDVMRVCWDEFHRLSENEKLTLRGRTYSIRTRTTLGKQAVLDRCRRVVRTLPAFSGRFDPNRHVELRVQIDATQPPVEVGVSAPCGHMSFSLGLFWTGPVWSPTASAIESKLGKSYESSVALELLVYFSKQHSGYFDRTERETLQTRFASMSACAPFQRIWVFDARRGVILALFPESDAASLGVNLGQADPGVG